MTGEFIPDGLADRFRTFAIQECRDYGAPLYERLALGVAETPELLALAARTTAGQPPPNLLFGAVQLLLLQGAEHPVRAFYPALSGAPTQSADPFPLFRAFCLEHAQPIAEIVASRLVQTNVVERSLCLMPAFGLVAASNGGRPLAMIEVGASAGLNLSWDRYGYEYGGSPCGVARSPVQLACRREGGLPVPLPKQVPVVSWRAGVDLNPLDVTDGDAALWLRALVWADHPARAATLEQAIALCQAVPPRLLAGDALDVLPELIAEAPDDAVLCVCHTLFLYQLARESKKRFATLLSEASHRRELYEIALGARFDGTHPLLELTRFEQGEPTRRPLARFQTHGAWIEWLDERAASLDPVQPIRVRKPE